MKLFYVLTLLVATVCASPIAEPPEAEKRWAARYAGRIQIVDSNGHPLGFVNNFTDGINGVSPHHKTDLRVAFNYTHGTPFTMVGTNFGAPSYIYLGGSASHPGTLIPKSHDRNEIGFQRERDITAPYAPPHSGPMGAMWETSIWTLDTRTKKLTPQWINPDHSKPETLIAYSKKQNGIMFVGDLPAYNKKHHDYHAVEVGFSFVSD
ncbi:hypothetical protein JAAARDRAFT_200652 [Jaapia argillacea MUCL 33604]|uniref:Uncharacterized protein n=1 Tax=Jaapia argillacea MUCL 33604 TaxID=933084 RepID=A0A067P4F1_9AGAM|nr:hypothetical protein JAAARDRAFT_200652 [Jaapia argillacea MUCL 33604]